MVEKEIQKIPHALLEKEDAVAQELYDKKLENINIIEQINTLEKKAVPEANVFFLTLFNWFCSDLLNTTFFVALPYTLIFYFSYFLFSSHEKLTFKSLFNNKFTRFISKELVFFLSPFRSKEKRQLNLLREKLYANYREQDEKLKSQDIKSWLLKKFDEFKNKKRNFVYTATTELHEIELEIIHLLRSLSLENQNDKYVVEMFNEFYERYVQILKNENLFESNKEDSLKDTNNFKKYRI